MINKQRIIKYISKLECKLGCYDLDIDKLNASNLKKVIDNIKYTTDTKVFINRKPYIVEIDEVDNEIDLSILTLSEYESRYGEFEE
ncbi:MAG: hypothetical protein RSE41_07985 [Clostridia bacterium]